LEGLVGLAGLADLAAEVGKSEEKDGKEGEKEGGGEGQEGGEEKLGEQLQEVMKYIFDQTGQPMSKESIDARVGGGEGEKGKWENPQVRQVMERVNQTLEDALERANRQSYVLKRVKTELYSS
jgi:hypothetical protein